MDYKKIVTARTTSNDLFKLTEGKQSWLLKRYRGDKAEHHRDSEKNRLVLWARQGFLVPEVIELQLSAEVQPYLVLQWINGCSLADYLTSVDRSIDVKIQKIKELIQLFYQRQQFCLAENSYDFIHHDPNTGNMVLDKDDFYYIDFEEKVNSDDYELSEALAIELAKFIRWVIRDLGSGYLDKIIQLTVEVYQPGNPILDQIIERVHGRHFQFIHRWKDRNKKKYNSSEVTKYDLADSLQFFLKKSRK